MKLIDQIKADKILAFKEKNTIKKTVLSSLIGELDRTTKDPDDELVIKSIQKMMSNNLLTNEEEENQYLEKYLPKQLTEEELTRVVESIIKDHGYDSMRNMGQIITIVKGTFPGQYDGKTLANIVKKKLL